jgi:hypothetical protein
MVCVCMYVCVYVCVCVYTDMGVAGLTGVRMLEFDLLNFVNFEADIHFAEDEGIVQVCNRSDPCMCIRVVYVHTHEKFDTCTM